MPTRQRILGLALCFLLSGVFPVLAVDTPVTGTQLKEELSADKQKISEDTQEMKKKSEAAKAEEQGIHKQIREARATGDKEKVKTLDDFYARRTS